MRLINADKLKEIPEIQMANFNSIEGVRAWIDRQPTIEAVPVVHAEWIADERGIYFCSVCDSEAYWDTDYGQQLFDHCPYCGADMRGKKDADT